MKRVLTVQDISCIGKCSLTVALPIISALGIETAILPTAVLSTHTLFNNYTVKDLDDQIIPITNHWQQEGMQFDALYSGYLATKEQIAKIKQVFRQFKRSNTVVIVDPAMADHGKLYPSFDLEFVAEMETLCSDADIIVPNLTEATLLTGMEYREVYDEAYIQSIIYELAKLGARIILLTGIGFAPDQTGVYGYDGETDEFFHYTTQRIDAIFHGTGDIFASTLTGAIVNDLTWQEAAKLATDYTKQAIQATLDEGESAVHYGVNFEQRLHYLIEELHSRRNAQTKKMKQPSEKSI